MSLGDFFRELTLPLRSAPILLTAMLIIIITGLVVALAIVNPWIAAGMALLFTLALAPGLTRYLVQIAEWRGRAQYVEPPSAEMFALLGSFWQLSAALILFAYISAWYWLDSRFGELWSGVAAIAFAIVYPAMVALLVITHSVAQALNPAALLRLITRAREGYWFAVVMAFATFGVPAFLAGYFPLLAFLVFIYLLFAFFAVSGAALQKHGLIDDVAIHDPVEPDAKKQLADLEKKRNAVLTHAYGFASRENRQGALQHIDDWLERDPDPDGAWQWFFEQMLGWERSDHALYFGQRYIHRLLVSGQQIAAVKVLLRGRIVNERFQPLPEDLALAIEAAEATGNSPLADTLRAG